MELNYRELSIIRMAVVNEIITKKINRERFSELKILVEKIDNEMKSICNSVKS